jgi:alkanesulfonate monooxygenase SsuD/methylene tetrahydromethanopterin reductase-like flavin-dependent oxidoreductase (luciferase family)
VLRATLPFVDVWNTWFDLYGNAPGGFVRESTKVDEIAERVGRAPREIERSACVLVVVDRAAAERPRPDGFAPVEGSPGEIAAALAALAEAGADEAILVVDPINETSIRSLGEALAALDA